ncbi:hypothetical protein C356_00867 [Cryptococcus neoformans c45]|nr:hypothetical protein C356_00867 [Cryptococcus neoformans var. grubii c45]
MPESVNVASSSRSDIESQQHHHHREHHSALLQDGKDPSLPANHPVNSLSAMRKFFILCTLSYSGFLANFGIAIIQVAFPTLGAAFGVEPSMIPNTIGYYLLGFAVGPLFWNPLSKTIGRRPVYLLGSALYIPCVIWMALSPSYECFSVSRLFSGLTSSFSQTVPPATIADIFIKEVRGHKMSMYAVAVVIAPAVAPLFSGIIVAKTNWHVLFWLVLGLAGVQCLLYFFIVPETLWNEDFSTPLQDTDAQPIAPSPEPSESYNNDDSSKPVIRHVEEAHEGPTVVPGHVGPAWMPWQRPMEYLHVCLSPFLMLRYISIVIPSIYYGSLFAWSIGITIVMPQKFEKAPYSFATIPLGTAFLAYGLGGILGKWSGGLVGDKTCSYLERKYGHRQPEHRLWALVPILPFMFVGLIIVGIVASKELHWIGFLIGGGLFFFCLSAATGLLQTYVLEGYMSRSMDTQAVFIFFKSIWGFVIPFFVWDWGADHGFLEEYAAQGALAAGIGAILCAVFIWKGYEIRKWQGMPISPR